MLSPDEIRDFNEAYRKDFNRHDADALRRYYADRINWTGPGPDDPVTDGDEIPDRYRSLFRSFPDIHIEFLHDFSEGYCNAHHWIMAGTNTGPIGEGQDEVAPTGRRFEIKGLSMLVLNDDGRIVDDHTYFDLSSMNSQLGLS